MDQITFFRQMNLALPVAGQRPFFTSAANTLSHTYPTSDKEQNIFHFLAPLSVAYLQRSVKLFPAKSIKARRASFLNHGSQSIPVSLASFGRMVPRIAHLATLLFIIPKTPFPRISPSRTWTGQLVHSSSHVRQHSRLP